MICVTRQCSETSGGVLVLTALRHHTRHGTHSPWAIGPRRTARLPCTHAWSLPCVMHGSMAGTRWLCWRGGRCLCGRQKASTRASTPKQTPLGRLSSIAIGSPASSRSSKSSPQRRVASPRVVVVVEVMQARLCCPTWPALCAAAHSQGAHLSRKHVVAGHVGDGRREDPAERERLEGLQCGFFSPERLVHARWVSLGSMGNN
mmetsp:Transcript_69413/g.190538  ORF Transcript_69413/g.190538 Transcript_69413/m.190538 type:complete len:203 (-) Transcript_69413:555-1163(-)